MSTAPLLYGTARVKVHTHPHDHAEYHSCSVTVVATAADEEDGSVTITLQDVASEMAGTSEVRSFHLPISRKVWMKSNHGHYIVVLENGSLVIKLSLPNVTAQLRWALALKPGEDTVMTVHAQLTVM